MTPSGIEPATFRFVAQHLNHCATAVPGLKSAMGNVKESAISKEYDKYFYRTLGKAVLIYRLSLFGSVVVFFRNQIHKYFT